MPNSKICVVIIDSMSAFRYSDNARLETEEATVESAHSRPLFQPSATVSTSTPSSSSSRTPPRLVRADPNHVKPVLLALNTLRQHLGFVTFLINWTTSGSDRKSISSTCVLGEDERFRQYLIAPYPRHTLPNISCGQDRTWGDTAPLPIARHITLPADPLPSYQTDSLLAG